MKKQYSISEARANFPSILREAEAGQEVELTKHGKTVAVVISRRELDRLRGTGRNFMDAYDEFVKKYPPEEFGFPPGFAESVRDKSPGREVTL